jgi:hypothetical protein
MLCPAQDIKYLFRAAAKKEKVCSALYGQSLHMLLNMHFENKPVYRTALDRMLKVSKCTPPRPFDHLARPAEVVLDSEYWVKVLKSWWLKT